MSGFFPINTFLCTRKNVLIGKRKITILIYLLTYPYLFIEAKGVWCDSTYGNIWKHLYIYVCFFSTCNVCIIILCKNTCSEKHTKNPYVKICELEVKINLLPSKLAKISETSNAFIHAQVACGQKL